MNGRVALPLKNSELKYLLLLTNIDIARLKYSGEKQLLKTAYGVNDKICRLAGVKK